MQHSSTHARCFLVGMPTQSRLPREKAVFIMAMSAPLRGRRIWTVLAAANIWTSRHAHGPFLQDAQARGRRGCTQRLLPLSIWMCAPAITCARAAGNRRDTHTRARRAVRTACATLLCARASPPLHVCVCQLLAASPVPGRRRWPGRGERVPLLPAAPAEPRC